MSSNFTVALLCEPYVGASKEVKGLRGLRIHQFPSGERVKACIVLKDEVGDALGLSQLSTSNIAVVQLRLRSRLLTIISAYIEPDNDPSATFESIDEALQQTSEGYVIFGLDGNGAHHEWGCTNNNERGEALASLAASHSMTICNQGTSPTFEAIRHGHHCSSIVDITMASDSLTPFIRRWHVDTNACPTSDHNAIAFDIISSEFAEGGQRESTYFFNNKTAKWPKFHEALQSSSRSFKAAAARPLLTSANIDEAVSKLTEAIRSACFASMKLRGASQPTIPFWTPDLQQQKEKVVKLHHRLHQLKRSNRPLANFAELHSASKAEYARSIRKASTQNFRDFCKKQGPEDVWSLTNRLIKDSPGTKPPATLRIASGFTSTPQETAEALLHHFYPDDTPDDVAHLRLRQDNDAPSTGISEPRFTSEEIAEALSSMNPNRAPGHDNLTSDICTAAFEELRETITLLLNACLDIGYFPSSWKSAHVRILSKPAKTDYTDLSSFRPIGLLPVFGKLLEKLMIKRLNYFAQSSNWWTSTQFGFREQTSTSDALRSLVKHVEGAKARQRQVIAVSLDIKAAFDNAWWPALHAQLRQMNAPSNIHQLIRSYLSERQVTLPFAGAKSTKVMTKGCIQGSVCGPPFWNMILDDLLRTKLPEGCHMQAYADDVMLVVEAKDTEGLQSLTNSCLSTIECWGESMKLRFSPAKTQAISFTKAAKTSDISIGGLRVPLVDSIKILGVMIDSNLNFVAHSKYIIAKASKIFKRLCLFVRPTWGVHPANVETIYRHVIEPIMTYAAGIWGSAMRFEGVRRRLRSFQRSFAIRAIRAFHTVSAVSALALAQFMPLHLKIREVQRIELVKASGIFEGLPEDRRMEAKAAPTAQLHPADRITISPAFAHIEAAVSLHSRPIDIYTDGSKLETGEVGCAFVVLRDGRRSTPTSRKFLLDKCCSVFQAEVFAIHKALKWCITNAKQDISIFSDSRSALDAIAERSNPHPLIVEIHNSLSVLRRNSVSVDFVWVKAHVGIEGNEAADKEAKAAAVQRRAKEYTAFPISYAKRIIRQEQRDEWEAEYQNATTGATTRAFFPDLASIARLRENSETSFEATQIFTGHGFHKSYLKRFHITPDDTCPCGTDTPQTLHHLLTSCPEFAEARQGYIEVCQRSAAEPFAVANHTESKPSLIKHFYSFITSIVSTLKSFNCT